MNLQENDWISNLNCLVSPDNPACLTELNRIANEPPKDWFYDYFYLWIFGFILVGLLLLDK